MDKQTFLESVTEAAREQVASEEEMRSAYQQGRPSGATETLRFGLSHILSSLGGVIVAIGIGVFVFQNWDLLSSVTKIFVTLGVGVIAFVVGNVFIKAKRLALGVAIHLLAAITLTIGFFVTLDQMGLDTGAASLESVIFGALLVLYLISYRLLSLPLLAFFSVLFGSAFFITLTNWLEGGALFEDFVSYQFLLIGLVWILIGHALAGRWSPVYTGLLYFFGLPIFFISALILGGDPPTENWLWTILFPALALGSTLLSLPAKSRLFLGWGAFFLVVDIFKITGNYFSEGFGWPLALVIAGLALMAVGALVVRVNKRYVTEAK